MWVLMIGLASCQDVAEQPAPSDAAAVEAGYPSLHTVPPRPQLSYTVEQRRAIVDGLVADRENARYSNDVVRYRAGLSSLPPPAPPALAAVPVPEPDAPDAAAAATPPASARDVPGVNPETEFLSDDDDLDTFMEEMDRGMEPPVPADRGEPGANAAPLGTRVVRASAVRPIQQAAYPGRPQVVTLAMPPATASLPVPGPAAPTASNTMRHAALSPPAPVEAELAGRAPGVVWGMPDMAPPPAEPTSATPLLGPRHAAPPPPAPVETTLAGRAPGVVWGLPEMAPAQPAPAVPETPPRGTRPASPPAPAPAEMSLAGRAPGVVWGMPDMAPAPGGPTPAAPPREVSDDVAVARAALWPAPAKPSTAPAEIVLADAEGGSAGAHARREIAPPAPAPHKPLPPAPAHAVLPGAGPEWVGAIRTATTERPAEPTAENSARSVHAAAPTSAPPPAPAKPALAAHEPTVAPAATAWVDPPMPQPRPKPVADAAAIELAGGLVGIDAASRDQSPATLWSVPFESRSARLTPDAMARLGRLLAEAQAREARIKIVGEADAPALALDRALAVGLALVRTGVPADRLELSLAFGGSGDQARLFLAAPEL
jgi:outer membrane protein OmpA-like peptidoglycan-associated protein